MPAAKPAPMRRTVDSFPSCRQPPLLPGFRHEHVARHYPSARPILPSESSAIELHKDDRPPTIPSDLCIRHCRSHGASSYLMSARAGQLRLRRLDRSGAHLVSKQALIEGVRAHAQRILEREMRGKGREPLPQGLCALMLDNLLPAVDDACSIAERHCQVQRPNLLAATLEEKHAGWGELEEGQLAKPCHASQLLRCGAFSAGMGHSQMSCGACTGRYLCTVWHCRAAAWS